MGFTYVKQEEFFTPGITNPPNRVGTTPRLNSYSLRQVMLAKFEDFIPLGTLFDSKDTRFPGRHIYIDRGGSVLGVAHLDSVRKANHFWVSSDNILACPTIDDRLGAWILLHGLPSIGIYPDVLLTEGEEQGMSTAADFDPSEELLARWGWAFSFDRTGTDAVFYQYGDGNLEKAFKENGVVIGNGSYSDIAYLDHLKLECVNMGCGMTDYHTDNAWCDLAVVQAQILKFAVIYEKIKALKFPYEARNSWRKRGKRNDTTYYHTSTSPYYGDDGQADLWKSGGRGPMSAADNQRFAGLARSFRSEFEKVTSIYHRGIEYELGTVINPYYGSFEDWRAENLIPDGANLTHGYACRCNRCDQRFAYLDCQWSTYMAAYYCTACYIEMMDHLRLLPAGWLTEYVAAGKLHEQGAQG